MEEESKEFINVVQTNINSYKNLSLYDNEFYLSFFRIFFPSITCKYGYIKDSISFSTILTEENCIHHKVSISYNKLSLDKFSEIKKEGELYVHFLKDECFVELLDEYITPQIIECKYISSLFPEGNTGTLQITNIGLFSVTAPSYSKKICEYIKNLEPKCIFDCTACVGGDTIGFFKYLNCNIISMEKEEINFNVLKHNVSLYKGNKEKIKIFHGDFLNDGNRIITEEKPDIIYFDPPWGGKDYNIRKNIELYLGEINIKDIISKLNIHPFVKAIVVKVPPNFNNSFNKDLEVKIYKMSKFNILVIIKK